ncbi:MAG: MJ0042-type zinc finger domain-containing protein [Planctomycetaceae bacterium]
MTTGISATCPHCHTTLRLKSDKFAGKTVGCPKCTQAFVIPEKGKPKSTRSIPNETSTSDDEFDLADLDLGEAVEPAIPAPVRGRPKPSKRKAEPPEEQEERRSVAGPIFRAVICINAHLAIAAVVLESLWDLFLMIAHWSEFQDQMVTWRFARGQLLRPMFLIGSALYVWWEAVLPRDRGMRHVVWLAGSAYLFLFGIVAFAIALMANSMYDRPIYAVDSGVVYLGFSLLAFFRWGYPPETILQLAERLTSEGNYADALSVVNIALQENPDDQEAYELYRALRDLMRYS